MNTALNSFRQDGKPQMVPALPPLPRSVTLSREFRLAAACSWIAPEALQQHQNRMVNALCAAGVDWDAFLALVDRHGIPVQALCVLQLCLGQDMPEPLCQALKARSKKTRFRSFVQMGELIRINRLLREHDIAMMPLKGVLLSQKLYGSPNVRSSGDVDVLIRPENLAAVDRLLAGIGYRKVKQLTERQMIAFRASFHHVNYFNQSIGQHLELHWRSQFWSGDDLEEFWRGRQAVTLSDEELCFSDDISLFLFLCDHGSRHRWMRLTWLADIAAMLAKNDLLHWDALVRLADRKNLQRTVAQAALLVQWLYELPLPKAIAQLVANEKTAPGLAKKALFAMRREPTTDKSFLSGLRFEGLRQALYSKKSRPALSVIELLRGLATCPTDYVLFPLSDRLFWMYVPLRPVFWFWRHFGDKLFPGLRSKCETE